MKQLQTNQVSGAILVVLPKFIGDAINTLPAVAMLRELYPNNEIHLLARPYMCDIFARDSHYRLNIIRDTRYDKDNKDSLFALAKSLKKYKFNMAVLLRGSLSEAILCKLTGIKFVLGYKQNGRAALLSHGLKLNQNHHYIHRYCHLINDCHNKPFAHYSLPQLSYEHTDKVVSDGVKTPIAVYFGGKNKGARHYPLALAQQALIALSKQVDAHFYLVGDPSETTDNQQLYETLQAQNITATDLTGKTSLVELVDCIAACELMISIDSGPMHMAAAVDTPCVAVVGFGTSPWSVVAPKNQSFIALTSQSCSLSEEKIIEEVRPSAIAEASARLLKECAKS
ncbi:MULTISPECIES: glycosyltransferase family 9 protein [Pseudoalteromonas]|uniref:Glycosyl transferase n=1 Tax=Pseudoalteromonas amylolytica TaxID=1859457 RepID=A0A1S1MVP9_9GAMM|nr:MULTISPECIES: glycosyltransferase family 9 protein [Pseudoalteromonas]OHU86386.1 glycosyl transferase [Pseudoalteromonas sp. JW3]OHU89862.1 glycosyl transferase [Pseudoalteromonas amylolytica]